MPTLREIGIDLVANAPYGLAGPKGMHPLIVGAIHETFRKGMEELSYTAALVRLDQEPFYMNNEEYRDFAAQQINSQRQINRRD